MTTNVQKYGHGEDSEGKSVALAQVYNGPLPPPEMLEEYNRVIPGSGDLMLGEFKKQGSHRRLCEKGMIIGHMYFGPLLSFLIVLVGMIIGYKLLMNDKSMVGLASMLAPIIIIASIIITKKDNAENTKKEKTK